MDKQFIEALKIMDDAMLVFEKRVQPPEKVPFLDSFVFRYKQKTIEQALVQKLARVVTGLRSAYLLVNHGMLQEQAAIQRMLDEFQQDVTFLSYAIIFDELTDLHRRYLDAFYMEEYDNPNDPVDSSQNRPSIPRQKIRAYIAVKESEVNEPSRGNALTRTLNKAYSGFVHGASPQIMNMYGGRPPRFQVQGQLNTPHQQPHKKDLWNYFYRGLISFAEVACAFRLTELHLKLEDIVKNFAQQAGKNYENNSEKQT